MLPFPISLPLPLESKYNIYLHVWKCCVTFSYPNDKRLSLFSYENLRCDFVLYLLLANN